MTLSPPGGSGASKPSATSADAAAGQLLLHLDYDERCAPAGVERTLQTNTLKEVQEGSH
jgi:hypothetical protein